MTSVSSESLASARAYLESRRSELTLETAKEFFSVLNVLDANPGLQRALTDPSREPADRAALFGRVLGSQVSETVSAAAQHVASARYSSLRDFVDTFETLGVDAAAFVAEREGESGIGRLENELFAFANTVEESHELQGALSRATASGEARRTLARRLTERDSEPAQVLLEQAVMHPRGLKVVTLVERFAQYVAARHNLWVAHVETSQELTPEQSQRLAESLTRVFGRELKINATTLPSLIGGVRVTVGDEVIDSSVVARINRLKQRLAS
ncbi:F0F1 ATP synthase subunit delta [Arthrobacter sp. UM1]|uniref:F0F1 ATP synthase subunit delta n=1 Tax=Arthrobacter sp. UM1 TaxID=2766776 RepID=UPI001CF630D7|nr:F0F1 ATP synthase subunit delta [Arthrobacter sp. UM1]MCB4207236.1 F0F1 ATP synthase subunit delta [Arthrobacter sp. UM1]